MTVRPTWARMAAWAVAASPRLLPREVAWVGAPEPDRQLVRLVDEAGDAWAVTRRTTAPGPGEQLLEAVRGQVVAAPPADEGTTTLADGSVVSVRPWVGGRPLRWVMVRPGDPVVDQYARLLATLHTTSTTKLAGDGPTPSAEDLRSGRLDLLDRGAQTRRVPPRLLEHWEEALEEQDLWATSPCLVHGDLTGRHVLTTSSHELALVTGWDAAHVGDPAEDLVAVVVGATPDVLSAVRSAYDRLTGRSDERLLERARLLAEMQDLAHLVEAEEHGDRAALQEVEANLHHRARVLAEAEELDAWD